MTNTAQQLRWREASYMVIDGCVILRLCLSKKLVSENSVLDGFYSYRAVRALFVVQPYPFESEVVAQGSTPALV